MQMFDAASQEKLAANWREARGKETGVVIVYDGEVAGWMSALRDPDKWRPGCIAVDPAGNRWEACGGSYMKGAKSWQAL